MPEFPYSRLRRRPDVEAENLQAWDATDLLLVDHALAAGVPGPEIAVIGDEFGGITLPLVHAGLDGIRVHQDLAAGRRALARNAAELGLSGFRSCELDASLLSGARLVLLQLPKSLAELEEIADAVARWAAPDAVLVAGGRVKHMTLAQNDVLGRAFARVQAQRAERKSRLVVAAEPLPVRARPPYPVRAQHDGLTIVAHGGAFAGPRLDIGTRVLLEVLGIDRPGIDRLGAGAGRGATIPGSDDESRSDSAEKLRRSSPPPGIVAPVSTVRTGPDAVTLTRHVVDLGCGTGILAMAYALAHTEARVTATDRSAAAVASARAGVAANGLSDRVVVTHDDAGSELPDASADVVLLNPPFHLGSSVHTGAATRLFHAAARLLRPGGELFTVYNSSLGYRQQLARTVGPTEQLHRTPKFTVTRSVRR